MKYLNEIMKTLPSNCLFDKGKVGCGGTTLAIENEEPYIICVPFQSLVENKVKQYEEGRLLGVMKDVGIMEIKYYLRNTSIPKIIVTYDSLPKVISCINPNDFNLLIDEYHILLTQYAFRNQAINNILSNFRKFKNWCFMTATPIEEEFILDELKGIPVIRQDWEDVVNAKVVTIKCDSVEASTIKLIKSHLSGQIEGNAYLFVNSTTFIKNIIKKLELTEENTRVIYSKNNKTNVGIQRGSTLDLPKKINLLTSTAFEGSDIYDENGKIYIISDITYKNTLLDISTAVQQIAGRIRNSKYIGIIYHLYNTVRYNGMSLEEFKASQNEESNVVKSLVEKFNNCTLAERKRIQASGLYMIKRPDDTFEFDSNLVKIDSFNYKIFNTYQVRVNLTKAYINNLFDLDTQESIVKMKDLDLNKTSGESFKEIVNNLRYLKEINAPDYHKELDIANEKYNFIKDAIDVLGFKRIESLKYVQSAIKNELLIMSNIDFNSKIIKGLNLHTGDFITKSDLKRKLINLFTALKIKEKPSASDIDRWFDVKSTKVTINGKRTEGFTIIRPKYKIL